MKEKFTKKYSELTQEKFFADEENFENKLNLKDYLAGQNYSDKRKSDFRKTFNNKNYLKKFKSSVKDEIQIYNLETDRKIET